MTSKVNDIDIYDEDYTGLVSICVTDTEPIKPKSSPRTPRRRPKSPSIDTLMSFDGATIEDEASTVSEPKNSKSFSAVTPTNHSYNSKARLKPMFIIHM